MDLNDEPSEVACSTVNIREVLSALDELSIAYRRATGLDGAYDPAIREAERVMSKCPRD